VSEDPQLLRAVTRRNVGAPKLSQNGIDTINKIIETVFMALLATVLGTVLAIPISFLAAQNLMRMVRTPLLGVAFSILAIPVGVVIGARLAGWLGEVSQLATANLLTNVGGVVIAPILFWGAVRWSLPRTEAEQEGRTVAWMRWLALLVGALVVILLLYLLSELAVVIGAALAPRLGDFDFIGDFIIKLGQLVRLLMVPLCACIAAGVLSSLAGGLGQRLIEQAPPSTTYWLHLLAGAAAGATLAALIGAGIGWLYEIRTINYTLIGPGVLGAVVGLLLALRTPHTATLPVGLAIYNVTRTVLNALRSVEALIMVIVFAVWVGIGPFAGVLALGLHTVASLAKLYSEQVEEISPGPLEAVLATGASRLQMIVYAVIPQIIPPYISFTMYRWDINVRMSTIIGFAGGGGIGFLLQQNINLLNYRAASAQIVAIAIVVSLMDYLSSAMRQRAI
jgi:phosphonate ABC transporter permease subunit PhnE